MTALIVALLLILPPGVPPGQVRVVAYAELPGDRFPVEGNWMLASWSMSVKET